MLQEELDEVALEKLAWVIAEEFVDSYQMLDRLERAEPERKRVQNKKGQPSELLGRMVLTWQF